MSNNGSIMELVAKSDLDNYLIDMTNKTSTFNFNIKKKNKYSKGDTIFYPEGKANWGNTVRFNIEKKGDLLYDLYLVVKLPKISISNLVGVFPKPDEYNPDSKYRIRYSDFVGNVLVEKISFYINGQLIDEQWGDYMQFYTDLYVSDSNRKSMLGTDDIMNKPNLKIDAETIYIPFKFWFCHDIEKPLPLIAMQNCDIYVDVKFRNFNECVNILEVNSVNALAFYESDLYHPEMAFEDVKLQANYYYVDLEERKQLAQSEFEIVITQAQLRSTTLTTATSLEIDFNHVVKDIMFIIRPRTHLENGEYFNVTAKSNFPPAKYNTEPPSIDYRLWLLEPKRHLLYRARMLFNGIERIEWRDAKYFYYMQNHENYRNALQSYVYVYSFNNEPVKDHNMVGCNFSRLDNAQLQVEIKPDKFVINNIPRVYYNVEDTYELRCFATNYNVLVIKNGLAGLKYQN